MSTRIQDTQRQIELALAELTADQAVNRVIMQVLLLNMTKKVGPEFLESLRGQVLGALARSTPNPDDPQGGQRWKELTQMRAERLFQELEEALGVSGGSNPRAGSH
ncbi:MAG TPA: hypothetical protein VGN97_20370 [Mesorhizobium sp.]|jgi:hypothetical protein|nr:hypothetical protein [Mesorhizobium sp.]